MLFGKICKYMYINHVYKIRVYKANFNTRIEYF